MFQKRKQMMTVVRKLKHCSDFKVRKEQDYHGNIASVRLLKIKQRNCVIFYEELTKTNIFLILNNVLHIINVRLEQ